MYFSATTVISTFALFATCIAAPVAQTTTNPDTSCTIRTPFNTGGGPYEIRCKTAAYGGYIAGVKPSVQLSFVNCILSCNSTPGCQAVQWLSGNKACYPMTQKPQTVGVVGAGVPQDANVAIKMN